MNPRLLALSITQHHLWWTAMPIPLSTGVYFFPMATNLSTKKYQFMPQTMILLCRHIEKSKPAKVIPRALVGEYQCDKQFLTRAWEAHVTALCSSPNNDYAAKFRSLSEKLKSPFDINVGGLSLESRELSLIIERSSIYRPREVLQSNKITCQVFLFLLRQAGKQLNAKDLKTLSLDRPHTIPQNHSQFDFGITTTLLIQAHAVGGIDV
ncbi:PREDICTED: uncharacterized protein LOC106306195 isoform X1 [Brassica oleracea var. oleracea]|uniref:uncharacterized protein LOC106306195 isoform X1 n=1 Tax=Brassica oleracea var. oleracea TaxID=109376 RepID=UPI0006A6A4D1|nr:PREDICTED: uncharacterized protein LOC106306195 isoform X1 [Brassica oleracea var. oleracea]